MSLSVGARLGPYEVTAPLGAGGMGEVYRARDTKLNRDVALKVLPAPFAADPERLARLIREAQLLASLNHPNIASIHGLEMRVTHARWCWSSSRAQRLPIASHRVRSRWTRPSPSPGRSSTPSRRRTSTASFTEI